MTNLIEDNRKKPRETMHYRVEYEGRIIYHIIASSDVAEIPNWCDFFSKPYNQKNGIASVFMKSDNAPALGKNEKNIYVPGEDADKAVQEMVLLLNKKNNGKTPIFMIRY